jgi:pyridoxamine 5'-phosphate oxidase-like protein
MVHSDGIKQILGSPARMAKQYPRLEPEHCQFIARQHMFFVASAAAGGRINISPKGLDGLRVLSDEAVAYLDLTGSGNETAAHVLADGRLTFMFCAFEGLPNILRLYGRGRILRRGSLGYERTLAEAFDNKERHGARQIVKLEIELVQTSCGYGVPLLDYAGDRPSYDNWANARDDDAIKAYQREKNALSIDGFPTGLDSES